MRVFSLLCAAVLLPALALAEPENPELSWDDLVPADYQPENLLGDLDLSTLTDADPRAAEAMAKLKKLWEDAPVVKTFTGQRVRLPGFAIPLESDTSTAKSFILVPYYGACIHVPPPPPNQIVHVRLSRPIDMPDMYSPFFLAGTLRAEHERRAAAPAKARVVRSVA